MALVKMTSAIMIRGMSDCSGDTSHQHVCVVERRRKSLTESALSTIRGLSGSASASLSP